MKSIVPHRLYKEKTVTGRYVTLDHIEDFLSKREGKFKVAQVGVSVEGRGIKKIILGQGATKILMWSQMHGNESTTTKSVLDLVNYLDSDTKAAREILEHCTLCIIPILNPDGAAAYTRINAAGIDLNRDAMERSQPESLALRDTFDEFRPDYCFNLHDQRTIYNVGKTPKPATVSFLAPAFDASRSLSPTRLRSMRLIVAMNRMLQQLIPGQVGRYDDAFNANCTGDSFQMTDTPTVLFEAGHFPKDYERERTREFIFMSLMAALREIMVPGLRQVSHEKEYLDIPENGKQFYDILIHHAEIIHTSLERNNAVGILYEEVLEDSSIHFKPKIVETGDLTSRYGHEEFDCQEETHLARLKKRPELLALLGKI